MDDPELDEATSPEEEAHIENLFRKHMALVAVGYGLIGLALVVFGIKILYDNIVNFRDTSWILIIIGIAMCIAGDLLVYKVASTFLKHSKDSSHQPPTTTSGD